jgi:hypothetical protein
VGIIWRRARNWCQFVGRSYCQNINQNLSILNLAMMLVFPSFFVIVLSVLWFTASDYSFDIFNFFFYENTELSNKKNMYIPRKTCPGSWTFYGVLTGSSFCGTCFSRQRHNECYLLDILVKDCLPDMHGISCVYIQRRINISN